VLSDLYSHLYTSQCEEVPEVAWLKRLEVIQNKLPGFVDLLNEREVLELAGQKVSANTSFIFPFLYFESSYPI